MVEQTHRQYILDVRDTDNLAEIKQYAKVVSVLHATHSVVVTTDPKNVDKLRNLYNVKLVILDRPNSVELHYAQDCLAEPDSWQTHIWGAIEEGEWDVWHLRKVSKDERYFLSDFSGRGVDIYIPDSGIEGRHIDFYPRSSYDLPVDIWTKTRVTNMYALNNGAYWPSGTPYHGTMVASKAAGLFCGCAKDARIFNCPGAADLTYALTAINAILTHIQGKTTAGIKRPSIMNSSYSIQAYSTEERDYWHDLVKDLTRAGVIHTSAAMNDAKDVNWPYPLPFEAPYLYTLDGTDYLRMITLEPELITLGNATKEDELAASSCYGASVRAVCYGNASIGAGPSTGPPYNIFFFAGGTSSAAPLAAGIIACYLESLGNPVFEGSAEEIYQQVLDFQAECLNVLTEEWNPVSGWPVDDSGTGQKIFRITGSPFILKSGVNPSLGAIQLIEGKEAYTYGNDPLKLSISGGSVVIKDQNDATLATLSDGQEYTTTSRMTHHKIKHITGGLCQTETPRIYGF